MKLLRQKKHTPRPVLGAPIRFYRGENNQCHIYVHGKAAFVDVTDDKNNCIATNRCWRMLGAM
jgi:hypothetical protein